MIVYTRIVLILLFFSCSEDIDLKPIDELIKQKKYVEALETIRDIENLSISDSLILKRIKHRKVLAKKGQVFLRLDRLFFQKDTLKIKSEMILVKRFIKTTDSVTARWYYFDYYHNKGRYLLLKSNTKAWLNNTIKALEFPSSDEGLKNSLFLDIAFYYAQKNEYVTAREWLDQALRRLNIDKDETGLRQVYWHYMNGKFHSADSILNKIGNFEQKPMWKRVHIFLNLYVDSLTIKNRFRLW